MTEKVCENVRGGALPLGQLAPFMQAVLDEDRAPVVLCDLEHTILYMNPVAIERYGKRGGAALVGRSLLECHAPSSREIIERVLEWFRADVSHNRVYEFRNDKENKDVYMIALRNEAGELIGYYEKHEYRTAETDSLYHME